MSPAPSTEICCGEPNVVAAPLIVRTAAELPFAPAAKTVMYPPLRLPR
jgi:hypothetical protein